MTTADPAFEITADGKKIPIIDRSKRSDADVIRSLPDPEMKKINEPKQDPPKPVHKPPSKKTSPPDEKSSEKSPEKRPPTYSSLGVQTLPHVEVVQDKESLSMPTQTGSLSDSNTQTNGEMAVQVSEPKVKKVKPVEPTVVYQQMPMQMPMQVPMQIPMPMYQQPYYSPFNQPMQAPVLYQTPPPIYHSRRKPRITEYYSDEDSESSSDRGYRSRKKHKKVQQQETSTIAPAAIAHPVIYPKSPQARTKQNEKKTKRLCKILMILGILGIILALIAIAVEIPIIAVFMSSFRALGLTIYLFGVGFACGLFFIITGSMAAAFYKNRASSNYRSAYIIFEYLTIGFAIGGCALAGVELYLNLALMAINAFVVAKSAILIAICFVHLIFSAVRIWLARRITSMVSPIPSNVGVSTADA